MSSEEEDGDFASQSEKESAEVAEDELEEEDDTDQEEPSIRQFSAAGSGNKTTRNDGQQGEAVRCQLGIWDGLLETRIKLQKPLSSANCLPRREAFEKFKDKSSEAGKRDVQNVQTSLQHLLKELVELQNKSISGSTSLSLDAPSQSVDDEEIPSDDDAAASDEVGRSREFILSADTTLQTVESHLARRHENLRKYRNSTLDLWNSKTQQFSIGKKGGFAAFDQSPVKQIEQILSDSERLVARTRIKRSGYAVMGAANEQHLQVADGVDKPSMDAEIFDDDDFYHQLLRELIERKTSSTTDPLELTRQQVQLAQLRKRTKKVVDSKATRDRKIKMDPHPKLVNFMAPKMCCSITEQARNDLYKSLFGKLQRGIPGSSDITEGIRLLN